jgi:hypothetical protein
MLPTAQCMANLAIAWLIPVARNPPSHSDAQRDAAHETRSPTSNLSTREQCISTVLLLNRAPALSARDALRAREVAA